MLTECLVESLEQEGVGLQEFRELCIRLLNYGVLCRAENQTEQQLYDRIVRIESLVEEYLDVIGITLFHDRRFAYLRLYPPGAQVPGMEDVSDTAFTGGLRARLRQDEVALLLVLRLQYDKALREGQLDEEGYVLESVESLYIAMSNLLGRTLPDKVVERKRVFNRLRQLRLIEFRSDDEMESGEAWIKIHPMIVTFVNDEAITAIEQALPAEAASEVEDVS